MRQHDVRGHLKELGVEEAIFTSLGKRQRSYSTEFLRQARLWAVYYLKVGSMCDDVLELRLGPVRSGKLTVLFRGRRKGRYSGDEPREVTVQGECPLK